MDIYTASMSYVRTHYEELRERHLIVFITAKHDSAFAPTWKMVMDHKAGKLPDQVYTAQYYQKMRNLWREDPSQFTDLLAEPSVVLVCFCKAGNFCHRYLLTSIFEKLGATNQGELK